MAWRTWSIDDVIYYSCNYGCSILVMRFYMFFYVVLRFSDIRGVFGSPLRSPLRRNTRSVNCKLQTKFLHLPFMDQGRIEGSTEEQWSVTHESGVDREDRVSTECPMGLGHLRRSKTSEVLLQITPKLCHAISALMYNLTNFTCEITKFPWQRSKISRYNTQVEIKIYNLWY